MRTCREITETIEKGGVKRLSIKDRLAIRIHLRICKPCKAYSKDSKIIERLLRRSASRMDNYTFTEMEKSKMITQLTDINK